MPAVKTKRVYTDSRAKRTSARRIFAWPVAVPVAILHRDFSARTPPSVRQIVAFAALVLTAGAAAWLAPNILGSTVHAMLWLSFMGNALLRLAATCLPRQSISLKPRPANDADLPSYSVIVPLYQEAQLAPQLLAAMLALDYPRDRLEVLIALEADDQATQHAFHALDLPPHVRVVIIPQPVDNEPRTKPRALNHALAQARGQFVVIYDAEDRPHPDQLMAAVEAFRASDDRLACLQAPLRPVGGQHFIGRQFAAEYAVQFDLVLPALNALGLPFPLGGTSNHFRTDVLKAIGGWDAHNVTEDADLGLRLAQLGFTSGLIAPPTLETPPDTSRVWLPQRTRWIKGFLQTIMVHMRLTAPFKARVWLSMTLSLAMSALAALAYAPFTATVVITLLAAMPGKAVLQDADLALFMIGNLSAMVSLHIGARRAGLTLRATDLLLAPFYWCLHSIAAVFALYQLVAKPFHWDKTEHAPAHNPLASEGAYAYAEAHADRGLAGNLAHHGLG